MPIHEFRCESCEYIFELLIMNREEIDSIHCPKCQSPEVERFLSAPNIANGGRIKTSSGNSSSDSGDKPTVRQHSCGSGSCTHIELPGHKR